MSTKENKLSTHPNAVKGAGNIKSIALVQEMSLWEKIDLHDPKAVQKRVDEFFALMAEHNSKPLVAGLAQALGFNRHVLYEITRGLVTSHSQTHIPQECKDIITTAYGMLEVAWEYNFSNGNLNPATGIFLAKNHYGYKNQSETVVEIKNGLGIEQNPQELEERLLASIAQDGKK